MLGTKRDWPRELASIGAYYHYNEAARFFRDLIGLPLYEQFEGSYGENGSIFRLPDSAVTFEIVQGTDLIPARRTTRCACTSPDQEAQQAAMSRLKAAGVEPSRSHPYWVATGGVTYADPDGH